jgi:Rrf2 family protein
MSMKLTSAAQYAISALAYMAARKHDRPIPSHDMAHAQGIPAFFVLKVLKQLVSTGVLVSLKGPNGGYRLTRPADRITLLEIVEAVDGPIRADAPVVGQDGPVNKKLNAVCAAVAAVTREQLGKVRLSDLAGDRRK